MNHGFLPRHKIYIALTIWLGLTGMAFGYAFKLLDTSNRSLNSEISQEQRSLALLEAEQNSYKLAREDLEKLRGQPDQPENFFSQDITLVNEIRTLENITKLNNVTLSLSGLSGTTKNASSAKVRSNLVRIPYSLGLSGNFADVINTLETIENLPFITELTNISVSSTGNGSVSAGSTAYFYLEKN